MAKVKVGIVGSGVMGSFHTKIAAELKEAKLIGVYDSDHARAQAAAEAFSTIPLPFLEELLKKVEALIIASPTSTHYEIAKAALNQGIHLLIEKPLTQDFRSSQELAFLAKEHKKILSVGMIERFNPAFSKALSIIRKEKQQKKKKKKKLEKGGGIFFFKKEKKKKKKPKAEKKKKIYKKKKKKKK